MANGFEERGRGDSILVLKLSAKIVYRVETTGIADFLNGIYFFCKHFIGYLKPVLDQYLNWRTIHKGLETASNFTAAHIGCSGKIFKRNMPAVMAIDEIKHFLQAYLTDKLNAI